MSSYAHLGIPHLQPKISIYHARSFSLLGISRFFSTCRFPSPTSLSPAVPTDFPYPHQSSSSYPSESLPGLPEVVSLMNLGTTKPPFFVLPLCTLYSLHTPQIRNVAPPTEPRLPAVSICRSPQTVSPLPPVRLPPQASPMSRILAASLASP